ncbi:MAG: alpha/beta hydrolase [Pseudomonadota bacterium]
MSNTHLFEGFEPHDIEVPGAVIHARVGGAGEPLLLLHGYPQTGAMWHEAAQVFAKTHSVVVADLRGYGNSQALDGDYTFRAMARDQVALMAALGFERFHVISHDRGARTAHRMTLDHPEAVASVALIDILPTLDVWRTMDDWLAKRYWHWAFLAQPGGMPERMIKADPVAFVHEALLGLAGSADFFDPRAMRAYEDAARSPGVAEAWCGDYAAGASVDLEHDTANIGETRDMPCLVLWGKTGAVAHHVDPLEAWQAWFPHAQGAAIDAGHFMVEEQLEATMKPLLAHLARSGSAL